MAYTVVGKSFGHIEGSTKVSGQAVYTSDLHLPGMVWGKILRSPVAHAKLLRIDTTAAKRMPGILAVLTAADLPDILTGRRLYDMPILARDRTRFIGERVALVVAEDPDLAEAAANQIQVEYEDLPAVFDPLAAMQEDAPILHEGFHSYHGVPQPPSTLRNVCAHAHSGMGDITQGFQEADEIFEHTFTTQSVHQGYLEPHAGVVNLGEDGRVHVWMSNKVPFSLKELLSQAVDLPPEKIVVHLTSIGGDFGGKGSIMDVPLCYYAAKSVGRPVKMVMKYSEEIMAANPRHPSVIRVKTGVKKDGRMVARKFEMFWNSGAYAAMKPTPNVNLAAAPRAAGPYGVPNIEIDSYVVYSNCVPCGHFRAPGHPQVAFAGESQIDIIAEALGIDRVEFRLGNGLKDGDRLPDGSSIENVRFQETVAAAVQGSNWHAPKPAQNVGRGMAISHRSVGIGKANARVTIHPDGSVALLSTHTDTGTGSSTIMCQLVAEVLSVPFERVRVEFGSTDSYESETGTGASRVTYVMGQATVRATTEVSELLKRKAAEALGCAPPQIILRDGRCVVRNDETKGLSFAELASASGAKRIEAQHHFNATEVPRDWSFSAVVAEVEVDPETGQVKLRNLTSAHDVGTIINPVAHQAQIDGGVTQGVGYALIEELQMQEGKVTTLNLGDYKLPNIKDITPLKTVLVEEPIGPAPFQAKEIGESPITPVAAAVANAVYDAVGVRITDLPITAEKIFTALEERDSK